MNKQDKLIYEYIADKELWKIIPWYRWRYEVSTLWRVKRNTKKWFKYMTLSDSWNWYYQIWLNKDNIQKHFYIHRLVAQSFLWLNISNTKMFVCHKDDDPSNNNVNNLFLWTHQDNVDDKMNKWRHGWPWHWEKCFHSKLKQFEVNEIRKMKWKVFQSELADRFNVSQNVISDIQNNKTWNTTLRLRNIYIT